MSFKKSSTKALSAGFWMTLGVCMLCIFAVVLAVVLSTKPNTQNDKNSLDGGLTNLTRESLINNQGWNTSILSDLKSASTRYGNNVALGNANGVQGVLVSLGGYTWEVVYIQNNIITLYACEDVATMAFDTDSADYVQSDVRAYLNNEFYPSLLQAVGFQQFDDFVVESGSLSLNYQIAGMQNVELYTTDNLLIKSNDITTKDKVWLPSAYEVGGFLSGDNASTERVNSFNVETVAGKSISSGLWNLSNQCRVGNNACLRSSTSTGVVYVSNNGNLLSGGNKQVYGIRPALNIVVPENFDNQQNTVERQGNLAISGSGTQSSPYVVSTADDLLTVSSNVLGGNDYSGKYIVLNNDIDLSGVTVWTPIGLFNNGTDSKPFCGTFDGQGFVVRHASSANTGLVGLFGYVSGGTVKNVAVSNTNWSTAGDYAGGIVSVMDSAASLSVSYNNSSVSGANFVGGLVGVVNLSGSTACTIADVYNTGAVAGSTKVGGLVGQMSSTSISRAYNIGTVSTNLDVLGNAGSSVSVTNTYYTSLDAQTYGTRCENLQAMRNTATFVGFSFYSSSAPTGVWFKSEILNDGFPTLKVFVKQIEVKLYCDNKSAGDYYVTLSGDSAKYKTVVSTLGTSATFTAQCNSGYRFLGWYTVVRSTSGAPVLGSDEATLFDEALQFNQTLTDYVYLEARFVKTFTVNVDTLFGDFSTSYANDQAVTLLSQGVSVGNQYDVGAVLTITVKTNITELSFVGLGYKTSGASSTYAFIGQDLDNSYGYWTSVTQNADSVVYVLTAGDPEAFTTDEFDIQDQFERQLNLTLSVVTNGAEKTPSASVQFGTDGAKITASTNTASQVFVYNVSGGLKLSVDYSNSNVDGVPIYDLDDWTLTIGSTDTTLASSVTSINIATYLPATSGNDQVYEILLSANFTLNNYTVGASAELGVDLAQNDSGTNKLANVYVALGSGEDVSEITADRFGISVAYGTLVSICFVPNFEFGYEFMSMTVDDTTVAPIKNANGVYYYDITMGTSSVVGLIKIKYIPIDVSPNVALFSNDTYTIISSGVTLSPTQFTSVNYYTDISALTLTVDTADNLYMCYGLKSVDVSFNAGSTYTTLKTYSGEVAKTEYKLFTTGTLVSLLYQQSNTKLTTTNNDVLLRITLYPLNTTLTVVACYKGSSNLVDSSVYGLTLSTNNQISSDDASQQYGYVLGSSVTIVANALNLGHKVLGYSQTANKDSDFLGTLSADDFKNSCTYTFTLNSNITLYVYFELRSFSVAFESNANTLASGSATLQAQGIKARDLSQTGNLTLNFDTGSTTTSTISMDYGHTLAYSATTATTIGSVNLILISIVVQNASTGTNLYEYPASTTEHTVTMLEDSDDNIYDNIKIIFRYNFKQTVYIKIASSVTDTSQLNGATIQFNNQDIIGNSTSVKLDDDVINQAQTSTNGYAISLVADEDGTKYTALFLMNISYKVSIGGGASSTQFELNLSNGEPVTFVISQIKFDNNAVNISGYFVFS